MVALMARLAARHDTLGRLPAQLAGCPAALRGVAEAAFACGGEAAPPLPEAQLIDFARAALHASLSAALDDADRRGGGGGGAGGCGGGGGGGAGGSGSGSGGDGAVDGVDVAEAIWAAARARGLGRAVLYGLKLPASLPARVWLERRRLEAAADACCCCGGGGATGVTGSASADCACSDARSVLSSLSGGAESSRSSSGVSSSGSGGGRRGHVLQRVMSALPFGLGTGAAASVAAAAAGADADGPSQRGRLEPACVAPLAEPSPAHVFGDCLRGAHGAAVFEAARAIVLGARAPEAPATPPAREGRAAAADALAAAASTSGHVSASSGRRSWLHLPQIALCAASLTGDASIAEAAAYGEAAVAAARGDLARLEALQAAAELQRAWWTRQQWQRQHWEPPRGRAGGGPGAGAGGGGSGGGCSTSGAAPGSGPCGEAAAPAFPSPGDVAYDRLLVAAAKAGRTAVVRHLLDGLSRAGLPPLQLRTRGALLMEIALRARRLDMIWELAGRGLAANAYEGHRLLQQRATPGEDGGADAAAVAEDVAAALALLEGARPGDAGLLSTWLLAAAGAGGRAGGGAAGAEAAAGGPTGASGALCARRAAALLRAVTARARAPGGELPQGARAAAPASVMAKAVLPAGDVGLVAAALEWLDAVAEPAAAGALI